MPQYRDFTLHHLCGTQAQKYVDELAHLRLTIFADFPYLYEGDLNYERQYLNTYFKCPDAIIVLVEKQGRIVGATTGIPLNQEEEVFKRPFTERGINVDDIFYCGESLLLPEFRGQGLGHVYFAAREQKAHELGLKQIVFCSVIRPATHPERPSDYAPLDSFWRAKGYTPLDGLKVTYKWKDKGEIQESAKEMQFWGKQLSLLLE